MKKESRQADRLLDAVGTVRDVWLEDAEALYESKLTEKKQSGFGRFLHSGWAVAAACLITAVGVYTAVMIAGRASAGGPGLAGERGSDAPGVVSIDTSILQKVKPPESISEVYVWADGQSLNLRPWSFDLTYPVTDENGKPTNVSMVADAACPHDAKDKLPYLCVTPEGYVYVDREVDPVLFFGDETPAFVIVKAYDMDGEEIKDCFFVIDREHDYFVSNGDRENQLESGRMWQMHFDDFDEPMIIEITAKWSGRELSGEVTYAFIRIPHKYGTMTDLPTDRGLTVYAWKMGVNSEPVFTVAADRNAPDYLTPMSTKGYSLNEMKDILSAYDLLPEQITVLPFNIAYSSYIWCPDPWSGETNEEWKARIERELRDQLGIPLNDGEAETE